MLNHQLLARIQQQLKRDGHAKILGKIPSCIFTYGHGNIIIDLPAVCKCDEGFSPAYAFFLNNRLHVDVRTGYGWQPLMATGPCLECAYHVDPLAKLPLELLVEVESQKHVLSMLQYYLLVWVVENKYTGATPKPTYAHLEGMFKMLERAEEYWPWVSPRTQLSADGAHESLAMEDASHDSDADKTGGRIDSVPRSPAPDPVTPEVTNGQCNSVETVALKNSPSPRNDTPNCLSARRDERKDQPAPMSSSTSVHDLLDRIRDDLGPAMVDHLPGITDLVWKKDASDRSYTPLALRVGYFAATHRVFPEEYSAWAYFKNKTAPKLELCVYDDDGVTLEECAMVNVHEEHVDLSYDDEFEMCRDSVDVVAITKYFFLLAAEAQDDEKYGLIHLDFQYTRDMKNRLLAMCRRFKAAALAEASASPDAEGSSRASEESSGREIIPDKKREIPSSSPQISPPNRTQATRRRVVSSTTVSTSMPGQSFATENANPTRRSSSTMSLMPRSSHRTSTTPPTTTSAECTSPHVGVHANQADDTEITDASQQHEQEGGLYPGCSTESSDGDSEIHFLSPEQRSAKAPETIALQSELARKEQNLNEAIAGRKACLKDARKAKKGLEKRLDALVEEGAKEWVIQGVRDRVAMVDERIRNIMENIGVFERSRAEAVGQRRRLKKEKGLS